MVSTFSIVATLACVFVLAVALVHLVRRETPTVFRVAYSSTAAVALLMAILWAGEIVQ